jgi:predicted DNA-binding transcriptional regulator YafY
MPWLLSWGGRVRVLEPDEVRQRMLDSAQAILNKNGFSGSGRATA